MCNKTICIYVVYTHKRVWSQPPAHPPHFCAPSETATHPQMVKVAVKSLDEKGPKVARYEGASLFGLLEPKP